jgi:hypothetical protein
MNKTEMLGIFLIILSVLIFSGYGLYAFVQATDVPPLIRIGVVALVVGFLVILLSLIRERLMDLQKERSNK